MSWIQYALLSGFLLGLRTVEARKSQMFGLNINDGAAFQTLAIAVMSLLIYIVFLSMGNGKIENLSIPGGSSALFAGVLSAVGIIVKFLAVKDGYEQMVMAIASYADLIETIVD